MHSNFDILEVLNPKSIQILINKIDTMIICPLICVCVCVDIFRLCRYIHKLINIYTERGKRRNL